jgi:hypothetical protein
LLELPIPGLFCDGVLVFLQVGTQRTSFGIRLFRPIACLVFAYDTGYITGYRNLTVSNAAQKRAIKNYRRRLQKRGLARFEVLGLNADRDLIRSLAKKLAQDDPEAKRIRSEITRAVSGTGQKGGILAALRRSPLVGSDLRFERPFEAGRKVDL